MKRGEQGRSLHKISLRRKDLEEENIMKTLKLRKFDFPYRSFGCPIAKV